MHKDVGLVFNKMSLSFEIELRDYKRDKVIWQASARLEVNEQGTSAGRSSRAASFRFFAPTVS
ncbi:MAG TPA: hypothetical protein VNO30_48970 [Kofleriaceae bacterium]|nr:hypothetical protein [Kofleriaceae bacterium]